MCGVRAAGGGRRAAGGGRRAAGGGRRAAVVLDVADLLLRPSAFGVAIAQASAIRHARRGARHLVPLTLAYNASLCASVVAVRGGHGHGGRHCALSCHTPAQAVHTRSAGPPAYINLGRPRRPSPFFGEGYKQTYPSDDFRPGPARPPGLRRVVPAPTRHKRRADTDRHGYAVCTIILRLPRTTFVYLLYPPGFTTFRCPISALTDSHARNPIGSWSRASYEGNAFCLGAEYCLGEESDSTVKAAETAPRARSSACASQGRANV